MRAKIVSIGDGLLLLSADGTFDAGFDGLVRTAEKAEKRCTATVPRGQAAHVRPLALEPHQ